MNVTITTDGVFSQEFSVGSYGVHIVQGEKRLRHASAFHNDVKSVREMEIMAITNAIFYCLKYFTGYEMIIIKTSFGSLASLLARIEDGFFIPDDKTEAMITEISDLLKSYRGLRQQVGGPVEFKITTKFSKPDMKWCSTAANMALRPKLEELRMIKRMQHSQPIRMPYVD